MIGFFAAGASAAVPQQWTPRDLVAPPAVWLSDESDISVSSGQCAAWRDLSGNGYDFEQGTSSQRPAVVDAGLGGRRTIRFDGLNDTLVCSATGIRNLFRNVSKGWALVVYRRLSVAGSPNSAALLYSPHGAANQARFSAYGSLSSAAAPNTPATTGRRLDANSTGTVGAGTSVGTAWTLSRHEIDWGAGAGAVAVNGDTPVTNAAMVTAGATSDTIANSGTSLSAITTTYYDFEIAEVIAGSGSMPSSAEVSMLEGYAAWKWGLQAQLPGGHPYKSAPPVRAPLSEINVFLVGGQSNAEGSMPSVGAPEWARGNIVPGVRVWDGSDISPYCLNKLGPSGSGLSWVNQTSALSDYSFAQVALRAISGRMSNVVACQVASAGTPLAAMADPLGCWSADYDAIPAGTARLLEALEGRFYALQAYCATRGITMHVRGMLWHQGESDNGVGPAAQYGSNFAALVEKVRAFTSTPDLPIYYGTIPTASASYNATVKAAQLAFAASDANAYCRDNSALSLQTDNLHFDAIATNTFGSWVNDQVT